MEDVLDDIVVLRRDSRFKALVRGLSQVSEVELLRLSAHLDRGAPLVLDSCHYDERRNLWCPLAVALDVAGRASDERLSNRRAKGLILAIGRERDPTFSLNPICRVPGSFYRRDRYADLRAVVGLLVAEMRARRGGVPGPAASTA